MANVSHATLTGAELHEPKGVTTANLGEVYVANGNGSGAWSNVGTSSFTGLIADFAWLTPQSGWLECNGTDVNTTTYSALYNVMTIQMAGARTSGNGSITSLSSTANMRVGYYVFGTGIASGTTITAINSSTQITISTNASSTGTSTVIVSPWLLNTGTIRLPDLKTAGQYRRTVKPGGKIGEIQAESFKAHTHSVNGGTSTQSADHTHSFGGTTSSVNRNGTHSHGVNGGVVGGTSFGSLTNGGTGAPIASAAIGINSTDTNHEHTFSGNTGANSVAHTHAVNLTSDSTGSTETRPVTVVFMTCVKT